MSGTGASRFLIRQAKLTGFDETRTAKTFIRERYDKTKVQLLLRFISRFISIATNSSVLPSRPDITIMLPNSSKNLTLGNGSEISIAAVARNFSYREIYRLYGRYCEVLN